MGIDIISAIEGAIVLQGGKALVKGDIYKSLSQILGAISDGSTTITKDSFKYFNAVRVAKVFAKVCLILEKEGVRNPQSVASKILFPAIEHISLDDELENSNNLQDLWANLLAGKASGKSIPSDFFDIVKRLDYEDAKALEILFDREIFLYKHRNLDYYGDYIGAVATLSDTRIDEACYAEELGYPENCKILSRVEILKKYGLIGNPLQCWKNEEGEAKKVIKIYLSALGADFMQATTGTKLTTH